MQHEVLLLVREHAGHNVDRGHVRRHLLAHQKHHARHVVAEMQLAGFDVNIAGQDVVQNDILDKRRLIVLFVVQRLDVVDRYRDQRTDAARQFILTLYENGVFQPRGAVARRMVGIAAEAHDLTGKAEFRDRFLPHLANAGQVGARNHSTARVHDTNGAIHGILHLQNNRLEQS